MKKVKLSIFLLFLSSLIIPFQNCAQDVAFETAKSESLGSTGDIDTQPPSGGTDPLPPGEPMPPTYPGYKVVTENFETSIKKNGKIDLIWVIDNSGSMFGEAQIVRNNLASFLDYSASFTDLKFALISRIGNNGTEVSLPGNLLNDPNYMQLNTRIYSTDGPQKVIDALNKNDGGLKDFLRTDSTKVYIFVTDDMSILSSHSFLSAASDHFPNSASKVFGFIGFQLDSPCKARTGTQYIDMSEATGGKVYNICDADWSSHFADLGNHVAYSANNSFKLNTDKVEKVMAVEVNGVTIDSSLYKVVKNTVTINVNFSEFFNVDKLNVKITYQVMAE